MSNNQKSADAFEEAAAPYERQIYFTCLRMMGNQQDAEDCAQEAMLKAFKNFSAFQGKSKFSTWIYTIAVRCCMDALRAKKDELSLSELQEAGWDKADEGPSPYMEMEKAERKRALERGISRLPDDQRLALVLCDLQGMSYEEAAGAIDCPIGTVRSRLNRARTMLSKILSSDPELFSILQRQND